MTVCHCGHSLSAHNHRRVRRWPRVCTKRGCKCETIRPVQDVKSSFSRFIERFKTPSPEGA